MTVMPEYPTPEAEPPQSTAERVQDDHIQREIGRLTIVTDGALQEEALGVRVERVMDHLEQPFFGRYVRFVNRDEVLNKMAGEHPVTQRLLFARIMDRVTNLEAARFWETPSGKHVFNEISRNTVEANLPYYYRSIRQTSVHELALKRKFRPVAAQYANHYPQVHFVDRLRRHLEQQLSRDDTQTRAANDLLTILGMSIETSQRSR